MASRKFQIIALSIGTGMTRLMGIATMMIMARILVKEDVAAYRQTLLAYAVVAPFLGLGIQQGLYYFLPAEKNRIRGRVWDSIAVLTVMGLLFAAFIGFGGNQLLAQRFSNPQVAQMLLWMIPYALITTPSKQFATVLVAQGLAARASIYTVIRQLFVGAATILPILIWRNAEAPLIGNVIASCLFGLEAIRLMVKSCPKDDASPSSDGIKELVKFSLPLGLGGMLGTISLQLDKMIVGVMRNPEEFAIYSLGAIEIPLIGIVTGSISAVVLADMRRAVADGNQGEAIRLFRLVAEKSACILFPVMLFFMIVAEPFITMLYGKGYADSVVPFRVYLLLLPIRIVAFGALMVSLGLSKEILIRSSIALTVNLVLSLVLVQFFGAIGAAYATVIVVAGFAVPYNFVVIKRETGVPILSIFPIRFLCKVTRDMLVPVGVSLGLLYWVGEVNDILKLLLVSCVFMLYLGWWWNSKIFQWADVWNKLRR